MEDRIDNGGPAFAAGAANEHTGRAQEGMSLRDYFAAQALAGYVARPESSDFSYDDMAEWSYSAADAMLAARKSTGSQA